MCTSVFSGVQAASFKLGDFDVASQATVIFGTEYRTKHRDPSLLESNNAIAQGLTGTSGSNNVDDGDLNYDKGDPVSTVLKASGSLDIKDGSRGIFLRGMAWRDFTLINHGVPHGNYPNGYAAGQPLSDTGLESLAKFSGLELLEAYAYGDFALGNGVLTARLGQMGIPWGIPLSMGGGLGAINAVNLAAIHRPGALPEEAIVPSKSAFLRYVPDNSWRFEGFMQFDHSHTVLDGCGTFYSIVDYTTPGCPGGFLGGQDSATSPLLITAKRISWDKKPQFGMGVIRKLDGKKGEVGVYLAQTDWRLPYAYAIAALTPATPFIPGASTNMSYATQNPTGVKMLAANFLYNDSVTTYSGELAYRTDMPLLLNFSDMLGAYASTTAPTLPELRAEANTTAPGEPHRAWDLYKTLQAAFATTHSIQNALGAEKIALRGEVAVKHVFDLADPHARRYGRSTAYGIGPINGVCPSFTPSTGCSEAGYVTPNAWGVRTLASLTYPNVFGSPVTLTPSVLYAADIRGWSYDFALNEGRRIVTLGLRADYKKDYYAELRVVETWGGYFNASADRSTESLVIGSKF